MGCAQAHVEVDCHLASGTTWDLLANDIIFTPSRGDDGQDRSARRLTQLFRSMAATGSGTAHQCTHRVHLPVTTRASFASCFVCTERCSHLSRVLVCFAYARYRLFMNRSAVCRLQCRRCYDGCSGPHSRSLGCCRCARVTVAAQGTQLRAAQHQRLWYVFVLFVYLGARVAEGSTVFVSLCEMKRRIPVF